MLNKSNILALSFLLSTTILFGQNQILKQKVEKRLNANGQQALQIAEDFNPKGFRIKRSMLSSKGAVKNYRVYNVDSLGTVLSDTAFNSKDEITDIWTYTYDEQGEIIRQHRFYPKRNDTYIEIYENTYDANNNLVKQIQYDKDSVLDWVYKYEFNKKNEKVKFTSAFQGTIRNEKTYKYKKELLIEEFLYDYENKELRRRENTLYYFKYDKQGRLLKKTVHSVAEHLKQKQLTEYKHSYNEGGNLIAIKCFEDKQFDSIRIYDCTYW